MTTRDFLEQPATPADHVVAYGDDPNQFGWLSVPDGASPSTPIAMLVHGGFWRDRYGLETMSHMAADLRDHGVAVWNVEYRRVGQPGGGYPGTGADVRDAHRHIETLAEQFPLDPRSVVVVGHSAGGQLAAWLAAVADGLRAAVSLAGVLDLRRADELGVGRDAVAGVIGGHAAECPQAYDDFSPYERLPARTDIAVFYGAADEHVPAELAERFGARGGERVRLFPFEHAGHFEFVDPATPEYAAVRDVTLHALGIGNHSDRPSS